MAVLYDDATPLDAGIRIHLFTSAQPTWSNLDGIKCIEVVESNKWSKLDWVTLSQSTIMYMEARETTDSSNKVQLLNTYP